MPKPKNPYASGVTSPFGYFEYLPPAYNSDSITQFPLIIYLHGLGDKGDGSSELNRVLNSGVAQFLSMGNDISLLVMSPQSGVGWWSNKGIDSFLSYVLNNYKVDTNRIYLTGLSAGAVGVYKYAAAFPEKIAAIVPITGKAENFDICDLKEIPTWAFHNADDTVFNQKFSIDPITELNQCGPPSSPPAKLTIYPSGGHDAWTKTYDGTGMGTEDPNFDAFDQDIFQWLLQHAKDTLIARFERDQILLYPQNDIVITNYAASKDGLHSYSWTQLEGPPIDMTEQVTSTLSLPNVQPGKYSFVLTIADNFSRSVSDTIDVTVYPINTPPIVEAGLNQVLIMPQDSVILQGTVTDFVGDTLSTKWVLTDSKDSIVQRNNTSIMLVKLQEGEYTCILSAEDQFNSIEIDTVHLILVAPSDTIDNLPYEETFESTAENWQSHGTTNSWEQGKPEGEIINQTSDGDQVWATNLTGSYQADESSFLISPVFDFSDLTNDPTISYDIWIDTDANDSTYLSLTYNNGATWEEYSLTIEDTMSQDGNGWSTVSHIVKGAARQESVVFRFGLESGSDASGEGIAIDNVVVCSTGKIISIPDTMLVEGESLQIPIELDNPDISGVTYQATSSNQEVLPDQNITISENLLEITSPLQVEGETDITVSSEQACVDGASFTLTLARVTAIGEPNRSLPAILYPNPGTGLYQIKAEQPIREIRLYGVAGRLLKVYPSNSSTKRQFSLDINDQPNGIYHIQVETAKQFFRQKLIKY
jgi:predicted esterase